MFCVHEACVVRVENVKCSLKNVIQTTLTELKPKLKLCKPCHNLIIIIYNLIIFLKTFLPEILRFVLQKDSSGSYFFLKFNFFIHNIPIEPECSEMENFDKNKTGCGRPPRHLYFKHFDGSPDYKNTNLHNRKMVENLKTYSACPE